MLKNSITPAEFAAFPAESPLRAEYKQIGESYILQHDEDVGELKRAKDREKGRADGLAVKLSEEQSAHAVTKATASSKESPLAIAAKAKEDALKEVQPRLDREARLSERVQQQSLSSAAEKVALELGGEKNKIALLPHVERRMSVKLDGDDSPVIVIKDKDGKDTTLKPEDLAKELRTDKNLASLVVVSAASGGNGRPSNTPVKSPASGAGNTNGFDFGKATPAERQAYIAQKREQQEAAV